MSIVKNRRQDRVSL